MWHIEEYFECVTTGILETMPHCLKLRVFLPTFSCMRHCFQAQKVFSEHREHSN